MRKSFFPLDDEPGGFVVDGDAAEAFEGRLAEEERRLLVPDQPAAAETFLTGAIRDYVLETCPGFYPEAE